MAITGDVFKSKIEAVKIVCCAKHLLKQLSTASLTLYADDPGIISKGTISDNNGACVFAARQAQTSVPSE